MFQRLPRCIVLIGEAEEDQREQGCTKARGGKELGVLGQQRGGQRWSRGECGARRSGQGHHVGSRHASMGWGVLS